MFNSFKRKLPEISIFHHPSSPPSTQALNLLRSSLSGPYPSKESSNSKENQPLSFNLSVVESPPTPDQLRTILSYLPSPSSASNPSLVLLSTHPAASDSPNDLGEILKLAGKNPKAMKWPIVVNWDEGKAVVGDVGGVKEMLEGLRRKRDGEVKSGDEVDQPKGWFS